MIHLPSWQKACCLTQGQRKNKLKASLDQKLKLHEKQAIYVTLVMFLRKLNEKYANTVNGEIKVQLLRFSKNFPLISDWFNPSPSESAITVKITFPKHEPHIKRSTIVSIIVFCNVFFFILDD